MKYIAIFCSANDLDSKYTQPAKEFATLIGQYGYHLVWGGGDKGLMGVIAHGVRAGGGQLIGVSMELVKDQVMKDADESIIEKTLGERKATMLQRADAVAVLVGGIGTLDEITEILELKKHKVHNKPIVILNTAHFYDGLQTQFEKMADEGFLTHKLEDLLYFAETPKEAIEWLKRELE